MTIERLLDAGRALEAGQLDQAERIYRQVADVDPRSSIAVVGLARVARRRGDRDGAVRLAARALEIDPANAAARRLLEEHAAAGPVGPPDGRYGRQTVVVLEVAGGPEAVGGAAEAVAGATEAVTAPEEPAGEVAGEHAAARGDAEDAGEDWPWPDLDEQLARHRPAGPRPGRGLLRRARG